MCGEQSAIELTDSEVADFEFTRPTCAEVVSVLRDRGALLAHFSGYPAMTSGPEYRQYPSDLKKVIDKECQSGISCSTIKPSDSFDPDDPNSNSAGCVGLIITPASDRSIIAAEAHDIGSNWDNGFREYPPKYVRIHIDGRKLLRAIDERSASEYNEWGVRDFNVVGVFAGAPLKVWREINEATLNDVQSTFADLAVYSFVDSKLVRRDGDAWVAAEHSELYP